MHIPDGYLSPATCATLYASAAPFWYGSLRRLRQQLTAQFVPLLSLFSAFSFVIMMFNLPLPGGTTGHAVGVAVAAIVLGPWGSIIAISTALLIQALFFGDGGITALGANCFNIAVVGSLVAYAVYRIIAGRAALTSRRRVFAAALAGYAGINASALITAIEFGIQPMLYRDPTGAPLYAPYPLSIAIPAMMIGHLTFAGVAELILSSGVVAYLQHTNPTLLKRTAGLGRVVEGLQPATRGWTALKPLWAALATLLLVTPLGVLATGTAWGEWSAQDFASPVVRQQIEAASGSHALPAQAPSGLARLASVWTAPFPDYAPAIVRHPVLGYVLSGMFGVGAIVLVALIAHFLLRKKTRTGSAHAG